MSNPSFPVPIPRVRVGGAERSDPADTGPSVKGDQKQGHDGVLFQTHNGGNHKTQDVSTKGQPLSDLYVWEE